MLQPTEFQNAVLAFRGTTHIFNGGGRGSGKSIALAHDCLDRCRTRLDKAAPLVTRESWSGLEQLREVLVELGRSIYGKVSTNKTDGTVYIHGTNSIITLSQIADDSSYSKHQGKTYDSLYQDEFGNYGPQSVSFSDRLRSNLRVEQGARPHIHRNANPAGKAHAYCMRNYIRKSPPGVPFREDPKDPDSPLWVWLTSNFLANPHLNQSSYEREIGAATQHSAHLRRAWLTGCWENDGGSIFQFRPQVHLVDDNIIQQLAYPIARLAGDYGSTSPATCLLGFISTHRHGPAPAGSVFIAAERDTADPNDLTIGTQVPMSGLAELFGTMCDEWKVKRSTPMVFDDFSGFDGQTAVGLLNEYGFDATKPNKKTRLISATLINDMLANATTKRGPALYINKKCIHLIQTLEEAPVDENTPGCVSMKYRADHWIDALAYMLSDIHEVKGMSQGRTIGHY